MERLTCINWKEKYGFEICENRNMCISNNCNECSVKRYQKLAHYEDLQEQGRLIELPCKLGDKVWYYIKDATDRCDLRCPIVLDDDDCFDNACDYCDKSDWFVYSKPFCIEMLNLIGKTVFLTREAAEQALTERQG